MYNAIVLEHVAKPQNMGTLDIEALGEAGVVGQDGIEGEGPFMRMCLRLEDDTIADARFETYGCPAAIACGSWLTNWVRGKTVEQVTVLGPNELSAVLGGLPLGKEHCAALAINALRSALRQLHSRQK
jgi:nitrogen fixation NifU-like protein